MFSPLKTARPTIFPFKLVLLLIAAVFGAETLVMFILPMAVPQGKPYWLEAVIDSCLLTLFTAPITVWVFATRQRTERELAIRARQQSIVADLGQRALAGEDISVLFDETVTVAMETLGTDLGAVYELNGPQTTLCSGRGWPVNDNPQNQSEITAALEPLFQKAQPQVFNVHSLHINPEARSVLSQHRIHSGLTVEIQGIDRPFGVLAVFSRMAREFKDNDRYFLQAVANVLATAIQRNRSELQRRERDVLRAEQMATTAKVAAAVAHELRNPLTSIKMLVQSGLESEGPAKDLSPEDHRIIVQEIRRMERCLQTFLDYARPPIIERQRFDLRDLLLRTRSLIQGRAAVQRVDVRFNNPAKPVWVNADWEQIQQLLLNLAFNGLDAMLEGGSLTIDLDITQDGWVELSVIDTGPGIPTELFPRLFEAFVTTKTTGVGLGLAVSRRIAENHGGTLTAGNSPKRGARFLLRLPLDRTVAAIQSHA
jgi:signal transduction histidine kinase